MALIVEDDCCGCASPGFPCEGASCRFKTITYICDECGDEVRQGELYQYGSEQLCKYCVTNKVIEELEVVSYE